MSSRLLMPSTVGAGDLDMRFSLLWLMVWAGAVMAAAGGLPCRGLGPSRILCAEPRPSLPAFSHRAAGLVQRRAPSRNARRRLSRAALSGPASPLLIDFL